MLDTTERKASYVPLDDCRIFVMVKERKPRQKLVGTLVGTGARVETFEDESAMLARLGDEAVQILFTDWRGPSVLREAVTRCPHLRIVLVVGKPIFETHGAAIMQLPLSNLLISTLADDADAVDPLAFHELAVTTGKLLTGEVFGLEKYLAWGTRLRQEQITSSAKRIEIVEKIGTYAAECGLRGNVRARIQTLADELMMNAIWDAPVDDGGRAKYAHLSRSEPLELLPEEEVTVSWGSDGNLLGVCVSDRFGRLQSDLAFGYLLKCFRRGPDQIDSKAGGAGLGLYMAYLAVSTFVINVQRNKRTEVIGLLNMHLSQRDMQERARSFQYFLASDG